MYYIRLIIGIILGSLICWSDCPADAQPWKVAIFDYDDRLHEPDSVAHHIQQKLTDAEPDLLVEQYSGRGDEMLAAATLKQLDRVGYDLIITVTSDALILAQHFLKQTPTLYTNVNNPLFLGFTTIAAPGGNISGASYYVPIIEQLTLFKTIQPEMKKVGFLFDEKNRSRQAEVGESRTACKTLGLACAIRLLTTPEELPEKTKELLQEGIGAIVATSSETVYHNLDLFKPLCDQAHIPIYSYHRQAVTEGAVAALASDYYLMVEKLVVPMALRVLRERVSPGTMPAAFLDENLVVINLTQAKVLGLRVSDELLRQATAVY